jgi:small subunit ribosomal protein S9
MLTRLMISRYCTSLRGFSSTSSSTSRRRFQRPQVENPRLRKHAVSIVHGDYTDDEPEEEPVDDDDDYEEKNNILSKLAQAVEDERLSKKKRKQDQAVPHPVVIDDLGRSYGRGGRKTASARVHIQPGFGEIMVNRMHIDAYFIRESHRNSILEPFVATRTCGKFDLQIQVQGGGLSGQAGAVRHGVARALNAFNPDLYRPALKLLGYLTRDPRMVERKKVGLKKSRKAPQWVRR